MEIEAVTFADKGQRILGSKMGSTRLRCVLMKITGSNALDQWLSAVGGTSYNRLYAPI